MNVLEFGFEDYNTWQKTAAQIEQRIVSKFFDRSAEEVIIYDLWDELTKPREKDTAFRENLLPLFYNCISRLTENGLEDFIEFFKDWPDYDHILQIRAHAFGSENWNGALNAKTRYYELNPTKNPK